MLCPAESTRRLLSLPSKSTYQVWRAPLACSCGMDVVFGPLIDSPVTIMNIKAITAETSLAQAKNVSNLAAIWIPHTANNMTPPTSMVRTCTGELVPRMSFFINRHIAPRSNNIVSGQQLVLISSLRQEPIDCVISKIIVVQPSTTP